MSTPSPRRVFATLLIAAVFGLAVAPRAQAAVELAGRRVLVLGDSITQDGRYVSFLEYYLLRQAPPVRVDLISIGLGSETVSGLSEPGHPYPRPCVLARLDRALELTRPEVVFVCYGMNDGIYHPTDEARLAAFQRGLARLLAAVRASGAKVVLITPPMFDAQPIRAKLAPPDATSFGYGTPYARYNDVLGAFARHELTLVTGDVQVIDLHTAMTRATSERRAAEPEFTFARDGVHPGDEGHLFMARVIATELTLAVPATDRLASEVERITADPLFAPVAARRKARSDAWLAHVGYTREKTVSAPDATAGEAEAARLTAQIDAILARP